MHDHKMETFVISTTIRPEQLNLLLLPLPSHKPRLPNPRTRVVSRSDTHTHICLPHVGAHGSSSCEST